MIFYVRLYLHHDNDLIQLHLNGIRLGELFAKALNAHYKKEAIQFSLPDDLELKKHKGRIYRIKVTLDDKTQGDLIQWVRAFPGQYKCHCIKNIARSYLGTAAIDGLNSMAAAGTWVPEKGILRGDAKTIPLKRQERHESSSFDPDQWLDQVSASRVKTEKQREEIEEGAEKIRHTPVNEILGTPGETANVLDVGRHSGEVENAPGTGNQNKRENSFTDEVPRKDTGAAEVATEDGGDDGDDFDASLFFEQLRTQR